VSLNLRNYQIEGVADVCARFSEGARRVLYQALTGSGKTVLFSFVVQNAVARGNRVAIVGHRQEIVDQINTALGDIDVAHGIIAADAPRSWSLDGWGKARSGAAAVCRCRECGALNPITARRSDACGAQLREPRPPIPRVEVRSGQLIEIDRLQAMTYRRALQWAGESEDRVRLVARVRGYKRGWVWHRLRELRDEDAA
jgi:Type III restriction enzyme, res subunit